MCLSFKPPPSVRDGPILGPNKHTPICRYVVGATRLQKDYELSQPIGRNTQGKDTVRRERAVTI